MDLDSILAELKREWNRLGRAIEALEGSGAPKRRGRKPGSASLQTVPRNGRRRRHMSAAARRKISEMMKKRWAERKRKQGAA